MTTRCSRPTTEAMEPSSSGCSTRPPVSMPCPPGSSSPKPRAPEYRRPPVPRQVGAAEEGAPRIAEAAPFELAPEMPEGRPPKLRLESVAGRRGAGRVLSLARGPGRRRTKYQPSPPSVDAAERSWSTSVVDPGRSPRPRGRRCPPPTPRPRRPWAGRPCPEVLRSRPHRPSTWRPHTTPREHRGEVTRMVPSSCV